MHLSRISKKYIDKKTAKLIPKSIAEKHMMIPINKEDDVLLVAMLDPYNFIAMEDLKLHTNLKIEPIIVQEDEIRDLIDLCFNLEEEKTLDDKVPVVEFIDDIIEKAIDRNASDIHIEPTKENVRIRFRIDGELHVIKSVPSIYSSPIISRIKVIGNMDIAEKRIAQDGRLETIVNGNEVDIRISIMPTVYGEKIVLRILNKTKFNFNIKNLGFNEKNLKTFIDIIKQPFGMVLVTGPTGSGKTTTMYTILKELNADKKNIITVEDPVEYKIFGVNQVQVNYKAGLDFASGLRSLLRQDPDYIYVGEIRDQETSRLAVRAAITGHLLFSTLHTNDSVSTIHRLLDMGIEPYLLSSSLIGVVSQRLIKLLCPKCKERYLASDAEKNIIGFESSYELHLFDSKGCDHCNNGYLGRTAIYEVLKINNKIRNMIDGKSEINKIKNAALESGMITLFESAKGLLLKGQTSLEEIIKIKT